MMTTIRFAILWLALLGGSPAAERPNILFIMIDDLGWMDLSVQGNKAVRTPNVDRFASQGMRFTDAYAAAPVCSPTRAAIMTGLAPARLHLTNHTPDQKRFTPEDAKLQPAPMRQHLGTEYRTLAEGLKEAGYATAFIGKWHLSGREGDVASREPQAQGFDINIGGCDFGWASDVLRSLQDPTLGAPHGG